MKAASSSVIVLVSVVVMLAAGAGPAEASRSCAEAANSPRAEPLWYAQECLSPMNPLLDTSPASRAPTDTAFAQDIGFVSDNFVTHTLNNFPGQTILGTQIRALFGYDFDQTATTLYALENDSQELGTISLTGAFTAIGPSVPLAGHTWSGLGIDPGDGTFYASSTDGLSSSLYTLNPATGAATLVGTDTTVALIIDISVNCEGDIYGHDIGTDSIYTIDSTTGLATLVGATGVDSGFAQGMDFDNQDGTLYAWTYQGGGANQYGTISLATGALTPLAIDNPQGEFEGATQTTCDGIFADGFESGDTTAWSSTIGG